MAPPYRFIFDRPGLGSASFLLSFFVSQVPSLIFGSKKVERVRMSIAGCAHVGVCSVNPYESRIMLSACESDELEPIAHCVGARASVSEMN